MSSFQNVFTELLYIKGELFDPKLIATPNVITVKGDKGDDGKAGIDGLRGVQGERGPPVFRGLLELPD